MMGVAIAYIRQALQYGIARPVASGLGPMPSPPWLAFVLQGSRSFRLT